MRIPADTLTFFTEASLMFLTPSRQIRNITLKYASTPFVLSFLIYYALSCSHQTLHDKFYTQRSYRNFKYTKKQIRDTYRV
jgi:hypothetical protein